MIVWWKYLMIRLIFESEFAMYTVLLIDFLAGCCYGIISSIQKRITNLFGFDEDFDVRSGFSIIDQIVYDCRIVYI